MSIRFAIVLLLFYFLATFAFGEEKLTFEDQNEALFQQLRKTHDLTDDQMAKIRAVFRKARFMGQGNPAVSTHPATGAECREKLSNTGVSYKNEAAEKICGGKYMAPLYDPETQSPEDAPACIDCFEFPNIPCAWPVVWVRAIEAAQICAILGKRLCDAHEWESACEGKLIPPDYPFDLAENQSPETAVRLMRNAYNRKYGTEKKWSYGDEYQKGICGADSRKTPGCDGGGWSKCGSNTYPAGYFPDCRSPLGVYDLNGNAAEHMNLPLNGNQMASRGSKELGYTEMKGSWFIFDFYRAHPDWCRWRAPFWHGSRVMDPKSHHNYHLGFRCCKTVKTKEN